jgi:hypothetical protein
MVFLVAEQHVVEQGAVTGQEAAGDLQGLGVVVLRLPVLGGDVVETPTHLHLVEEQLLLQLDYESDLSRYAKVGHYQVTNL